MANEVNFIFGAHMEVLVPVMDAAPLPAVYDKCL